MNKMKPIVRLLLAIISATMMTFGIIAIFAAPDASNGIVETIASGAVLAFLSAIPSIPTRFSLKEGSLEFSESSLESILGILSEELDTEVYKQVERLIDDGSPGAEQITEKQDRENVSDERFREDVFAKIRSTLRDLGFSDELQTDHPVITGERGRPPILDCVVSIRTQKIAIVIKSSWNKSIADSVLKRINRVLKDETFTAALIVVDSGSLQQGESDVKYRAIERTSVASSDAIGSTLKETLRIN